MDKKYRAADFGRLVLHWLLTMLGIGVAFSIAYTGLWDTGERTGDPFACAIYAVSMPRFITGAVIIAVGYIFVWKLWLKKDLIRCVEVHWEWVALYAVTALWNMVLIFALGIVFLLFRMPGLFSNVEPIGEWFPLIVIGYMILFSGMESLITALRKKTQR